MQHARLWLHMASVLAVTLVIPKNYPNHRLTYTNGPRIINSALNENTRMEDYFAIPDQITNLPNRAKTMCAFAGRGIYSCSRHDSREILFAVKDSVREVRFEDINGNCLTAGPYDEFDDSYEVILTPCKSTNSMQIFILNRDHGHDGRRTIDRLNIASIPAKELRNFRQYGRGNRGMLR